MWSRQIKALLEDHDLESYIDESTVIPTAAVVVDDQTTPNPAFGPWRRQDMLLYSSLIGAISLPLQSIVSSATITCEVWDLLTTAFGNPTRGHIRQLKYQIKTCVKGTKSISEYLRLIKSKADDLALLGKPLDVEDLTEQILAGLPEEFKPEVDSINGRDTQISYPELHERLLNREAMILCTGTPPAAVVPVTANAAVPHPRSQHQNNWKQQNSRNPSSGNYQGNTNRGPRPYLGRCQACGVQGHSAKFCPEFRMVRGSQATQWQLSPQNQNWRPPTSQQPWHPTANAAMIAGDNSTWLLDSGASHHMTSDLANMSLHAPYNGGDDVIIGDGSALQISHTSSSSLPSFKQPFFLNNVLYVPSLDKNLISVFQLCYTNVFPGKGLEYGGSSSGRQT